MNDFAQNLTAFACALPALGAGLFVLRLAAGHVARGTREAWWALAAAGCLVPTPLVAALKGWGDAVDREYVPAWWFSGPRNPEAVLTLATGVTLWQVLIAVGLWRTWRAIDAADAEAAAILDHHARKQTDLKQTDLKQTEQETP